MYNDRERPRSAEVKSLDSYVQILKNENPPKLLYKGRKFEQKTIRVVLPYCWYETVYLKQGSLFRWAAYSNTWYVALVDMAINVENSGTILETLEFEDDSVTWESRVFY